MASSEAALISAICEHGDIAVATTTLRDDMFTSHRDVWIGLKSYYRKYHAAPPVSVLEERFNNFEGVAVTAPTAYYADALKEDYLNREISAVLIEASKSDEAPERVLSDLQKSIGKLSRDVGLIRDLNVVDYQDAQAHYEQLHQISLERGGSPGIMSGFQSMDICYPTGMAPGHLVIMLGYSARGKTWLASGLAVRAWGQGYRPMIVSLEMTPEAMRDRIYAVMGDGMFTMTELQTGAVDVDNFRTWSQKNLSQSSDLIIVSTDGIGDFGVQQLQAKFDEHKPDIVFVDYIQLMGDSKRQSETERIRNISRDLKTFAVRNNVPVVAISAVTMTDITAVDSPPMLEQVAYSKAIQYDADLALSVHKYDGTNIVECVSRKNRHGQDFAFFLEVDLGKGIMRECHDANV